MSKSETGLLRDSLGRSLLLVRNWMFSGIAQRPMIARLVCLFGLVAAMSLSAHLPAQADMPAQPLDPNRETTFENVPLNLDESPDGLPDPAGEAQEPPSVPMIIFKMLGALALILGLILLVAHLARRYVPAARRGAQGPDAISILSVKSLGPRRSLLVVRAKGRTLLLGSTPNAITRLADLDLPAGAETDEGAHASFETELSLMTSKE